MTLTPAWARRRIMEPVWTALTGASLVRSWRELEQTQYLSLSALQDRQLTKLQHVTAAACRNTEFYGRRFAEAGLGPEIRTFEDLQKLPILTKRDVRESAGTMMARRTEGLNILEFPVQGGSTGVPLILFISEEISHQRNAAARRSNLWSDWRVGESVGAVWGNPKLPQTVKERLRHELLEPTIYLDTMTLTPDSVRQFAQAWKRERPTMLFGHAHSIYLVARMAAEHGIDDIRPRAILSTSMMLLEHERRVIESVFNVKVTNRYGCEEVGLIGCECERHQGMHVNVDHLIVEFLGEDGTEAKAGEIAYVVVTDLINDVMPMLRYRVEDLAAQVAGGCPCGRGLPLMDRVAGRSADFLIRADGTRVAGISLIENTLTRIPGIEQMQIVQEELSRITLRVVLEAGASSKASQELKTYFASTFPGARIGVEPVQSIAREPNGKYRFSICRVIA